MRTFHGHTAFVQALAFTPDGCLLASAGSDSTARVWDACTGRLIHTLRLEDDQVGAVAFAPDGTSLAAGTHDGSVTRFELETGSVLHPSWTGQGRLTALAYTPDGRRLAWSSYPGWLIQRLGEAEQGELNHSDGGLVFVLRLDRAGRMVATAGTGHAIELHDLHAPDEEPVELPHGDRQGVWSLAFSPDGKVLGAALAGGVQLWDVPGRRLIRQWRDHSDVVTGIAISADGTRLLTSSWDRTARLYEFTPSGQLGPLLGCYDWKIGRLFDVAISPDGTLAVAGGDEGAFLVAWDVE